MIYASQWLTEYALALTLLMWPWCQVKEDEDGEEHEEHEEGKEDKEDEEDKEDKENENEDCEWLSYEIFLEIKERTYLTVIKVILW